MGLLFSSELLLKILLTWPNLGLVDPDLGHGSGWGLPGSTNSYSPSYTIRATENANTFSFIRQFPKLWKETNPAWLKKNFAVRSSLSAQDQPD